MQDKRRERENFWYKKKVSKKKYTSSEKIFWA